jgi:hypothetical protein
MFSHKEQRQFRVQVGQPIGFFYGFKTNGILQNQQTKCDSNGAPYFADQRPEMFVLLIKIKMEQSMIKTKYIWAIQISN